MITSTENAADHPIYPGGPVAFEVVRYHTREWRLWLSLSRDNTPRDYKGCRERSRGRPVSPSPAGDHRTERQPLTRPYRRDNAVSAIPVSKRARRVSRDALH